MSTSIHLMPVRDEASRVQMDAVVSTSDGSCQGNGLKLISCRSKAFGIFSRSWCPRPILLAGGPWVMYDLYDYYCRTTSLAMRLYGMKFSVHVAYGKRIAWRSTSLISLKFQILFESFLGDRSSDTEHGRGYLPAARLRSLVCFPHTICRCFVIQLRARPGIYSQLYRVLSGATSKGGSCSPTRRAVRMTRRG